MLAGEELRALMRRFPAGVAVVTVDLEGQRVGLTVASLVSLSLEPPLVGVAVRRGAALHELLRDAAGPPQLEGAVGWLTCRTTAEHDTGDHTFFVGEVEAADRGPGERPLVF